MSNDLTLYTNPMSRGRIARWMLEESGASYETKILTYDEMKSADYLAVNPMGKVPAIRHGQDVVTECAAICAYLADSFPAAGLSPQAKEKAAYYRWLFFAAGPLEAAVTNRPLGFEVPADKTRMAGYGTFHDVMNTLESALTESRFIAGDRFTAADVYIGSHIGWGLAFGSFEKRHAFVSYLERVTDREAYRKAAKADDEALAALSKGTRE